MMFETDSIIPEEKNDRRVLLFALIVLLLSGYFLFLHQPENGASAGAVSIGVIRSDKSVRVRHARTLHWGNMGTEGTVYLRDIVYTPKDTTAEFIWNDKILTLEPESMVQFDEISLDRMEIVLIEGRVKSDPSLSKYVVIKKAEVFEIIPVPKHARSEIGDIATLELLQSELSQRTGDFLARKIDLEPLLDVRSPNIYLNRLSDYNIRLISPLPKDYNVSKTHWVPLRWAEIPLDSVEYSIEVSRDSSFRKTILHPTRGAEVAVQFDGEGEFYWKVKAKRKGETSESEASSFSLVTKGGIPLEAPRSTASQSGSGKAKAGKSSEPAIKMPKPPALPTAPGDLLLK